MTAPSPHELRRAEDALWGPRPRTERVRMRLVGWKPLFKGILRGFTTGEPPIGLTLIDCGVLVGTKGAWANPPVKPQLDKDGRQKTGADGKPVYAPPSSSHTGMMGGPNVAERRRIGASC
jgi:hypothetical protein